MYDQVLVVPTLIFDSYTYQFKQGLKQLQVFMNLPQVQFLSLLFVCKARYHTFPATLDTRESFNIKGSDKYAYRY